MCRRCLFWLLITVAPVMSIADDDVVTYLNKDGKQLKRTGTIDDYTGAGLKITLTTGRQEQIEVDRIVEIRTNSSAEESTGDTLLAQGKLEEAIKSYAQAVKAEKRSWVMRRIQARLVDCYERLGNIDQAGEAFLAIVAMDSETPHLPVIPLAWRTPVKEPTKASAWLTSKQPVGQLLGASWLLGGAKRSEAMQTLKTLSGDLDPAIAHLAAAQLWRTSTVNANRSEVDRWQQQLMRMPAKLRGGPSLIIGDALARLGENEDGLLAYLQTPLLHRERTTLANEGYESAARLLEKLGRPDDAARVQREVVK